MLLKDVVDRAVFICEEFNDTEVASAQMYDLYWTVLIAIANGQCEDASPKEFAAAVIGLEAETVDMFRSGPDHADYVRQRIAGRKPEWLEIRDEPPPAKTKKAPKKKPKPRAKKQPPLGTQKKHK